MARVIVPDVGDLAAASRRIGAQTVGYVKPHLFDYNSVKEVVGTAEKIASNPLVVAGIDAFRVSGRKADAEAADAMILDATATGEADALARKAAEARFRALQERRADGTAMGRASMQPAGRRGPEQAYTAPTQDRIAEPAVGERMAVPQAAPAPVAPPAPQVDRISAQQMGRAAKIAALSERLQNATTDAEVAAIDAEFRRVFNNEQAPSMQAAEDMQLLRSVNDPRTPTGSATPPGPAQPVAPQPPAPGLVKPEIVEGREVWTPGAGMSMATDPLERELEAEMAAAKARGENVPAPAPQALVAASRGVARPSQPAGAPAAPAAPQPPERTALDVMKFEPNVADVAGRDALRLPAGKFSAEALNMYPPAAGPSDGQAPDPAPVVEESVAGDVFVPLTQDQMRQAVKLSTASELLAAARSATTLDQQRLILSRIDDVELPATNIFQALGLAPKTTQQVAFAKQVAGLFPKGAADDPLTRAKLAKLELETTIARSKDERAKEEAGKKLAKIDADVKRLQAAEDAQRELAGQRKAKAAEITTVAPMKAAELQSRARKNDKQGIAALRNANAAIRRAGAYERSVGLQERGLDLRAQELGLKPIREALKGVDAAKKAADAEIAKLDAQNTNVPDPGPPKRRERKPGSPEQARYNARLNDFNRAKAVKARLEKAARLRAELVRKEADLQKRLGGAPATEQSPPESAPSNAPDFAE
jgi:hypothetical protein